MSSINPLDRQRAKDFQRFSATEADIALFYRLLALRCKPDSLDFKYAAIQANHAAEYASEYSKRARIKMDLGD